MLIILKCFVVVVLLYKKLHVQYIQLDEFDRTPNNFVGSLAVNSIKSWNYIYFFIIIDFYDTNCP
jgi:hypothetical protein